MNERIKLLAEQAGFSFKYKTAPDEMNPGHKLKDLKKFAELIVKECADVADQNGGFWRGCGMTVKRHFGVE